MVKDGWIRGKGYAFEVKTHVPKKMTKEAFMSSAKFNKMIPRIKMEPTWNAIQEFYNPPKKEKEPEKEKAVDKTNETEGVK